MRNSERIRSSDIEIMAFNRGVAVALSQLDTGSTEYLEIVKSQGGFFSIIKYVEEFDRIHLVKAARAHLSDDDAQILAHLAADLDKAGDGDAVG